MGFSFVGANRAIRDIEDRKERREQFMMGLMEKRKAVLIPELIKRYDEVNAKAQAKTTRLKTAKSLGLSTEAASVLEASGELEVFVERLAKIEDLPTSRVRDLSEAIVSSLPEEKVSQALNYALDTGVVQDPTSDGLIDVLYANTEEDLTSAFSKAMSGISGPTADRPAIAPLDINTAALKPMDSQETARVRKNVEESLKGVVEHTIDDAGNIIWKDPASASTIIDNAVKYYARVARDPLVRADPIDVINRINESTRRLKNTPGIDLIDIATDYPDFPLEFEPPIQDPPPPPPPGGTDNLTLEQQLLLKNNTNNKKDKKEDNGFNNYIDNFYIGG